MKTLNYLILTFAAAFLILAGLSSCKKQTADNKPTPDVSFEKLTFEQIKGNESEMKTDPIQLKKDGDFLLKTGQIIIFKTNQDRYGKLLLTKIVPDEKLTFKGVCYNADGSVHNNTESFELESSYLVDLDIFKSINGTGEEDLWYNNADVNQFLRPQNKARVALFK